MQSIPLETLPTTFPTIQVGDVQIEESAIAGEMQFHPAASREAAAIAAARALVIQQLLRQQAAHQNRQPADEVCESEIAAMLERELAVPEPDDNACRRYHAAHPERFSHPPRFKVRHILLAAAPDDTSARDTEFQRAERLIDELKATPERFTELAQRHSRCPSAMEGGGLGWLIPGQTVEELDRALVFLPMGLHDRPLPSRYGWHVVHVDAREEAKTLEWEDVVEHVRHELREQATRMALRHYLLELESRIGVKGFSLAESEPDSVLIQ
ncbi:peptidylprolyl isomerase [Halomonas binhaiensis]|uniref:peptidylprolyl isomerase n=1 Tax=Halomonas binhaiensis TaxID=2562282 RepID=A0A5C1NEG6_9GAMM|nr:peptidylprolyl isomerase [Halomonas binhaiensis]QEM81566.1 peptidylprolyl isomerase [Halomonas binhaiensis]